MRHTACNGTWHQAFAQLLTESVSGRALLWSRVSKAKPVFEGEGGTLGRQKDGWSPSLPTFLQGVCRGRGDPQA